jgi:hypothetical protein
MTSSSKRVAVECAELVDAFEFANFGGAEDFAAYIHLDTGVVYCITGQPDLDTEVPDDIAESDRYLALPDKKMLGLGSRLVFEFTEREMEDSYDTVRQIFQRRGAYGRFKDLLHEKGMVEKWYAFEQSATEQALRDWCEENELEVIEKKQ